MRRRASAAPEPAGEARGRGHAGRSRRLPAGRSGHQRYAAGAAPPHRTGRRCQRRPERDRAVRDRGSTASGPLS